MFQGLGKWLLATQTWASPVLAPRGLGTFLYTSHTTETMEIDTTSLTPTGLNFGHSPWEAYAHYKLPSETTVV